MRVEVFVFALAVFALAGFVKGVIGLGLPTISMGLLVLVMPPIQAAALLVLPALLANVWQMCIGPSLKSAIKRIWPMLLAIGAGAWLAAGLMTGGCATDMREVLGLTLALYALSGFANIRIRLPKRSEMSFGVVSGGATGILTAATGVFVIPAVPYLQAIGLERDELVQALGVSFTVSTLALAANAAHAGAINTSMIGPTLSALVAAICGMGIGRALRSRLHPRVFRRWFFAGLFGLGLYLVVGI